MVSPTPGHGESGGLREPPPSYTGPYKDGQGGASVFLLGSVTLLIWTLFKILRLIGPEPL